MAAGFNPFFAPFFAIYYGFAFLVLKKWRHFCLRVNKKSGIFPGIIFCVLQQNALGLAPNSLAFCCILQGVLLLNARCFNAFYSVILLQY